MKKRLLSFVTALVMIAGFCVPASAAGIRTEALELIPVEDVNTSPKVTVIDDNTPGEGVTATEADISSENEDGVNAVSTIRDYASPTNIFISPVVYNEDLDVAYIVNDVKRSKTWLTSAQFEALYLSPAQVNAMVQETYTALKNYPETSSYEWWIIGWYIEATFRLTATRPLRVEYKQSFIQSPTEYETKSYNITQQSSVHTYSGVFLLHPNVNPNGYYNMGFDGTFYYRYASGPNINKETGIPFSCSVSMNSNNG